MAIIIPHRFLDRLLPDNKTSFIETIIIGTFNPGLPASDRLSQKERQHFETIASSKKFQKFNQVRNFYDRPQNRFWKIMDFVANSDFYLNNSLKTKNANGLKYYTQMDREIVFRNQIAFCLNQGILITDIVSQIEPASFENIYDNFPDKAIENSKCEWNTKGILGTIEKYRPKNILINFSTGKSIPKISEEISKIQSQSSNVYTMLSTSGAAGYDYTTLAEHWYPHIIKKL